MDNTYLGGIYRLTAINFLMSAKRLESMMEKKSDGMPAKITAIPFYFLISHAAELFLKSALLKRGWQDKDLKNFDYRHNLGSMLKELQKTGVAITSETVHIINELHEQHKNHSLRYTALLDNGEKTYLPPPSLIYLILDELLLATKLSAS